MFSIPTSCKRQRSGVGGSSVAAGGQGACAAASRAHVVHHHSVIPSRAGPAHQEREDQHCGQQKPLQVGPESKGQEGAIHDDKARGVPAGQGRQRQQARGSERSAPGQILQHATASPRSKSKTHRVYAKGMAWAAMRSQAPTAMSWATSSASMVAFWYTLMPDLQSGQGCWA